MTHPRALLDSYLDLIATLQSQPQRRSEADLVSHLKNALEAIGLHAIIDTTQQGSRGRPDILAYTERADAAMAMPAEVVLEAKRPDAVAEPRLVDALTGSLWATKTLPYIRSNLSSIHYFILTTFEEFVFVRITPDLRHSFRLIEDPKSAQAQSLRHVLASDAETLSLARLSGHGGAARRRRWSRWWIDHLSPNALSPFDLADVRYSNPLRTLADLELFATRLADLAAGSGRSRDPGGLYDSLRRSLPNDVSKLDPSTVRDFRLFVMARNPAKELKNIDRLIQGDVSHWLDEFVGASIHSLISRLFVLSLVEDRYCVDATEPLLPTSFWVMRTPAYDALEPDALLGAVFDRLQHLSSSSQTVLQHLAVFGAFFDWIRPHLDPVRFRSLFLLFSSLDFRTLDHDLLGRFFELYSQKVNATRRRELGQYYTPLPIVRYMWHLAADAIRTAGLDLSETTVLDPAVGSGTFLKEGAQVLAAAGSPDAWNRLVGFDISTDSMGVAQANVYMAVLAQASRASAEQIDELRLYTTDTLDPRNGRHLKEIALLFTDAAHRGFLQRSVEVSSRIKRQSRFGLVIANPPYRNNSALTLAEVAGRFPALLQSSVDAAQAQTRNIRDDYAWFFAAATYYTGARGFVCFVTSDTYTHKSSFRHFRIELLKQFEILSLIRLGSNLFQDVGPRIHFAVILMRKRVQPLAVLAPRVEIPYADLRPLEKGLEPSLRGLDDDPRLQALEAVVSGRESLSFSKAVATQGNNYSFVPASALADRVLTHSAPVVARKGRSLFRRKWPGIITAFDVFFRAESADELRSRVASLFEECRTSASDSDVVSRATAWSNAKGFADANKARIVEIARQIRNVIVDFDDIRIRRSFAGSIPNESRWWPPKKNGCFLYYEPRLKISRNTNPGKDVGWGTMNQWREPASHSISPKLVFTSSTNPAYGYKAYVLDDTWYVKLHGGKSQQYNYTGLVDPLLTGTLTDSPNNLTSDGEALAEHLGSADALLYYIAGIYNSELAKDFLAEELDKDLQIHLPKEHQVSNALRVVELSRSLTMLSRLAQEMPDVLAIPLRDANWLSDSVLTRLGATVAKKGARGFKPIKELQFPDDWTQKLATLLKHDQAELDDVVEQLYGA